MISVMLAVAAVYGTDPSPAGAVAVRELLEVSAAFCAASYREDDSFDPDALLKPRGFALPGTRKSWQGASGEVIDLGWNRPDGSLTVAVRVVAGRIVNCTVASPLKVWNQMEPAMPAYVRATRLPLKQDAQLKYVWRGGGMKASARAGMGGTVVAIEPDSK